jgi:pimeloyl-ACP methyl ester carboxylesterase
MNPLAPARPVYLDIDGVDPVFSMLHMPADPQRDASAVLICPPFGWEDCCSYRSRREWAEHLARAGHPTLRIDLPGAGDSGGVPEDPGRLAAWTGAIGSAAGWLSATTGDRRVAAIGIGLGGLLICQALAEGAPIDEVILWAVPSRGRTFVREIRAFARLEASKSTSEDGQPMLLPDGWTGAGGFVLSDETTRALENLDLATLEIPDGQLNRALLIEREGIPVDQRLRSHFEAAGVPVTVVPGIGYSRMMDVPHEARPPVGVFAQTQAWLGADASRPPVAPSARETLERTKWPPRAVEERSVIELAVDGVHVRETPLTIEQPFGRLFAVLAEPVDTPQLSVTAVLLNAGAHRRIGQDRMWVEAGRRWAARGVPTLRLDLEGIGDADGDAARFSNMRELYTTELVGQTLAALDALDARSLGPSYVLAGLCSGAFWAFHAALRDERVSAAFMINPQTLFWDASQYTARVLRHGLRKTSSWSKVLRGRVPLSRLAAVAGRAPSVLIRRAVTRWRTWRAGGDELDLALDRLRDTDKHVQFLFSGREPLCEELEREGRLQRMHRWPNVDVDFIPGQDHILRPLESQRFAHRALDHALEQELRRAVEHPVRGATDADVRGPAMTAS